MNTDNYLKIKNKIPSNVNILAVSKGFKSQEIKTIQNIGQNDFGESKFQEAFEKQAILKNFRNLGIKKSFNLLLILVERLFQNIILRIDQGAESLLSKREIIINTDRFRTFYPFKGSHVIGNTLSICFIGIAIFLRKLYGAL